MLNKRDWIKNCVEKDVLISSRTQEIPENLYPSGKKVNWIFDFRPALLNPDFVKTLCEVFADIYKDVPIRSIGGLETAAIPLVSALSIHTNIPGFFVRKSRKKHSILRQTEGNASEGEIILVDDLIGSGDSIEKQIKILEAEGKKVAYVFTIVQFRPTESYAFLTERNIQLTSLFNLKDFGIKMGERPKENTFALGWYFGPKKPHYFEQGPKYTPLLEKEDVYMPSDNGTVWKLDYKTGKAQKKRRLLWKADSFYTTFTNIELAGKHLYIGTYNGTLFLLKKENLRVLEKESVADTIDGMPRQLSNAVVVPVTHIHNGGQHQLLGLDPTTLEQQWYISTEGKITDPVYVDTEKQRFISSDAAGFVYACTHTGDVLWKQHISSERLSSVVHSSVDTLLCTSMDGNLYEIHKENGKLLRTIPISQWLYAAPAEKNGIVYITSLDRNVYAVDLQTETILWTFESRGRFYTTPLVHNDAIYVGNNEGILYKINNKTGMILARHIISERITNQVTIVGQSLLVPTFAGELYQFTEKSPDTDAR